MGEMGHRTFRGNIFKKAKGSRHTYILMVDPQVYVDTWMKVPGIGPLICDHNVAIKQHLANTNNCISEEVTFDYDLIEVIEN